VTDTTTNLDFNNAGEQRVFDVIPAGTIVTLQITVRPGGTGDGGWLKRSANGESEAVDCEFTVVDGQYAKRKVWQLFTLHGTTPGHAEAGEISRKTFKAILESARGFRPDDKSAAAQAARSAAGWQEFNNLRFVAKLGVRPPQGNYPAKNTILEVITPDRQVWKKPEQVAATAAASNSGTPQQAPATPPANAISRPQWAE
jgi:hypothetical protein